MDDVCRYNLEGRLTANRAEGADGRLLEIAVKDLRRSVRAGQFFMLRVERPSFPFINRPFSVLDIEDDSQGFPVTLMFLIKNVGPGTACLADCEEGEVVRLIGPLGNAFPESPPGRVVLVAGGVGVAPLVLRAKELARESGSGHERCLFLLGGATSTQLYCRERLEGMGTPLRCSTEDGSYGRGGKVDILLREELERQETSQVLACGPGPMLEAVGGLAEEYGVSALLALENYMACGFGVCNSCAVKVRDASMPEGYRYARSCREGPIFAHSTLIWT